MRLRLMMLMTEKKRVTVRELLGIGIGCIGMSYDDFCRCEYDEFTSIYNAWKEARENQNREFWEQTRLLAAISIQPYTKKKITPQQLIPLPWDHEKSGKTETVQMTKEERMDRFRKLITND